MQRKGASTTKKNALPESRSRLSVKSNPTTKLDRDKTKDHEQERFDLRCLVDSASPSPSVSMSSINLVNVIRGEVEDVMNSRNFKQEIAQEMLQLDIAPQKESSTAQRMLEQSNYIKLDELKDIVNKLISRNVVHSALEGCKQKFGEAVGRLEVELQQQAQSFSQALLNLEQKITKLGDRVEALEKQKTSTHQAERRVLLEAQVDTELAPNIPRLSLTPTATSGTLSSDEDTDSDSHRPPTKMDEKLRTYDELIRKYDRRMTTISASGTITNSLMPPANLTLELASAANPLAPEWEPEKSTASRREREQFERQAAERKNFETNMLVYQKSPFTLQLNSQKDPFPQSLRNALPQMQHHQAEQPRRGRAPPRSGHVPRMAQPRSHGGRSHYQTQRPPHTAARYDEEDTSDWLYDQ